MDALPFIKEFGLPIVAIIAIALFLNHQVWPFCVRQIEQRYKDQQERHMKMLVLLDRLSEQVTVQRQQSIEALNTFAAQMTELVTSVGNLAHLVNSMASREETRHPTNRQH